MTRTNAAGVLTVLLRAGAVYLVVRMALLWPQMYLAMREAGLPDVALSTAKAAAVLLAIALALWVFADVIVRLALARPDQPPFESDLDVGQWQLVFFSAIGLVQLLGGLATIVSAGLVLYVLRSGGQYDLGFSEFLTRGAAEGAVQLVLGAALLLGARGLVGLVHRLRGYDRAAPPVAPPPAE